MASIIGPVVVEEPDDNAESHQQPIRYNKYLGNLGKPTLRGVRKCTKCGTLNGTRGIRCKNKNCDQVFKCAEKKKPYGPQAVKLITDPNIEIYSVRTKTGDARGFVQLPIVQDIEGNPAVVDVGIVCSAAKCFIETCSRSKNESLDACFHIRSSVEAIEGATPLLISESAVGGLLIPEDMKQQILNSITDVDRSGPLVQRVTKNIIAVKTAISTRHPLGYLHFTFFSNKREEKRFVCSCREAKMVKVLMAENGTECTYKIQRCAHFYACLCAFASDEKLAKEFKFALDADMEERSVVDFEKVAIGQNDIVTEADAAIESVSADFVHQDATAATEEQQMEIVLASDHTSMDYTCPISPTVTVPEPKRLKTADSSLLYSSNNQNLHPSRTHQGFIQWLNMVTEMINQTMHFQLPGNPRSLIFHIPQAFWDCLQQRISLSALNKRRLPDRTTTVIRTDSPPIGTFIKFSWFLTELSHVRKVFDTAEVALLVSKYFDKCRDGSYKLSVTPRVQVETLSETYEPRAPSKSHEYKTFLRVGQHGSQGNVPFVIDWVPDLFPITRTGELSITFQYSHLIDGLAPAVHHDMVKQVIDNTSKNHVIVNN